MPAADGDVPSPDELVDFSTDVSQGVGPGAGSPEPMPMGPSDSVPIFRTDLKIDKGANAGLFEVTDPVSGRHFTLYEFELSIARMLDGRRHASDVIENGVRLGIPNNSKPNSLALQERVVELLARESALAGVLTKQRPSAAVGADKLDVAPPSR